ncbi:MAG: hypothetical protein BMS9Abin02_0022 [Anaerolineae bacterium]|nr:MAG: hypothetical protein BMS9Abin02_0022 [Anaerolineae bacterium]
MIKSRYRSILALLALLVIILIFFSKILFSNLVIARGDIFLFFFPYWEAASRAVKAGALPNWNDSLFMGAPLLANSQVGFFYPLNWLVWLFFDTPKALTISIVLHIIVAGVGAYLLGRKCLKLGQIGSLIVAVLFSLGGYFTSQVEHINQLQGMAWLPWFCLVQCGWIRKEFSWRKAASPALAFAILLTFQILAGHTQTTFITLAALLLWSITESILNEKGVGDNRISRKLRITSFFRRLLFAMLPLIIGGLIALLISSVQLLPTFELISQSTRQGGLPASEVLSFSLHPLILTRALLPVFEIPIFSEYVAGLPIIALVLAFLAAWYGRGQRGPMIALILMVSGLLLALGAFNPIYHVFARLPVFNLFRAPARWLILYTLGASMLAGIGWQYLADSIRGEKESFKISSLRRPLTIALALILILMVWGVISVLLSRYLPVSKEAPIQMPSMRSWIAWLVELAIVGGLLIIFSRRRSTYLLFLIPIILVVILYLGSRQLPYNSPTTPEAYSDLRPPIARLLASEECAAPDSCQAPGGRLLSMSEIFFDLGDQEEINSIYEDQLSEQAQYDYTVAIKQKEVLGPNLPLAFGLQSVDGFDGGLLPLKNFSEITKLLLQAGAESSDGRLREFMTEVPKDRWLDLFNVRYLITDKVGDQWREDVFFDLQNPALLLPGGSPVPVGYLPSFEATEAWMISSGDPGFLQVVTRDGESWTIEPEAEAGDLIRFRWPRPAVANVINLLPCNVEIRTADRCQEAWEAKALSLVDGRDESFYPLALGLYRIIHSGDVKIYENLDVLPRSFLVNEWAYAPDIEGSLDRMGEDGFDPRTQAVLIGDGENSDNQNGEGRVSFNYYKPGDVSLNVTSNKPSLLILTDSIYPGWKATIDGAKVEIYQTDINFRGVMVPEGEHIVKFSYEPRSQKLGIIFSIIGLLGFIVLGVFTRLGSREN